jgi:carboxyl-terminal processing protease
VRLASTLLAFFLFWAGTAQAVEKNFGGVGLQVVPTIVGELVVLNVVKGAPAAEGGILPGDLIVQVDDFILKGSDFTDVVSRFLWGEAGTSVTLGYLRPGREGLTSVTLRRVPLNSEVEQPAGVRILTPGDR